MTVIELAESERESLRAILTKGMDWRERHRAETIVLLAAGHNVQSVAEQQGLCREAVRIRRRHWLKSGLASLPDRPPERGTEHVDGRTPSASGPLGGKRSLVLTGGADAIGARLRGRHWAHHIADGIAPAGLCLEADPLQLEKNGTRSGLSRPETTSTT